MLFTFLALSLSKPLVSASEERSFVLWMRNNNQIFVGNEYHFRLGVWLTNQNYVRQHNSQKKSFKLSMNSLAHLTPSEYRSLLNFRTHAQNIRPTAIPTQIKNFKVEEGLDLRTLGHVNPIQNCGACPAAWAFTTAAIFESSNVKYHQTLYKFSEQFLIDCVSSCQGCDGGDYYDAVDFVFQTYSGGMMKLSDYPYKESQGTCKVDKSKLVGDLHIKTFVDEPQNDDIALNYFVGFYKVVAACNVDADHASFQLYYSGVYDEPNCNPNDLNYLVNCVGYGTSTEDIPYFIIRNNWGKSWGEEGYIRMLRGSNQCGLSNRFMVLD
ncbi:Cathepsin L1 [Tritrichomonas foetus]|uniref:Cathepsin L1 n=1 Tax=Tritrichomonas foetus TaxID=1144522 RepID=A0A1J4K050_9EUKA|nr:Cathepsin L1 [Tritrichomonas foetus]|eukprot:OHT03156.1 Cathepsin L1 [Tritrichomonas foetus]